MLSKVLFSFFIPALLAGCATAPMNTKSSASDVSTFEETELADGHYRLAYFGKAGVSQATVEDTLLFKSAELTLEKGYSHFALDKEYVETRPLYDAVTCPPAAGHETHDFVSLYRGFPYYAYGFDWTGPCEADVTPYSAMTYVKLYTEAEATSQPKAYDAQKVLSQLGSPECWQKPGHDHSDCHLVYP